MRCFRSALLTGRTAGVLTLYKVSITRAVRPAAGIILNNIDIDYPAKTVIKVRISCPDRTVFKTAGRKIVIVLCYPPVRRFEANLENFRLCQVSNTRTKYFFVGGIADVIS